MKKRIVFFLMMVILAAGAFAQPTTITWQGKLLDASGNAITQNNVSMNFAIFDASTAGIQLWPSSGVVTKTVNVVNGLYSVQMGTGTGEDIVFTATMFNGKSPWLEVKVGTETLPRTEITNVPFALISNDLSEAGWENPGEIGKTSPNTAKFTTVETGSVKITTGAGDGKVLSSDATGNATWQNPALSNFADSNYVYETKTGVKLAVKNDGDDVDLILSPKGAGGIFSQKPDGTAAGGDNRGIYAVDWQTSRGQASQVASGNFSVVAGGYWNEANSNHAMVGGGSSNLASGSYSAIPGGKSNTAEGLGSTAFGVNNEARGMFATVSGYYNSGDGDNTFVAGSHNIANDYMETVLGQYASLGYGSTTDWIVTDRLFTIGNGASAGERNNAITVLKNGNTTIGGTLKVNQNKSMSWYTFPDTRGIPGQVMTTDGDGHAEWTSLSNAGYLSSSGNSLGLPISVGTNDDYGLNLITNGSNRITISNSGTIAIPAFNSTGIIHNNASGILSSSLIVNGDISSSAAIADAKLATISTAGKVANTATTAASSNTASSIVSRDASGNFTAGTITASLSGNASSATNIAGGAQGSLPYQTAAGTSTFLAKGTAGQVLTMNSGATAPEWKSLSKSDIGLGSVENTALSTWTGSTNLTSVGTIATGTWHGTAIAESYIGNLSASKITSGTFDNARINWAAPGAIGSTTASSGAFTTLSANNGLSISGGTVNIKPAGSGGTSGQVLTTDGSGDVSWTTPNTGLSHFTESNFTYDSRTGVKLTPNNAATDVDFVLQPKGTGAIIAQQPGGTSTGGNKRGDKAVDLQTGRINAAQVASGDYAALIGGRGNTASGNYSVAMGLGTTASGDNSISMGSGTTASGANSIAMGEGATASGNTSVAMGEVTTASGIFTTALGYNTSAPSGYETVSGSYNTTYSPSSATSWVATDRLFVIGNGTADGSRSNALTILKNANTTIGGSLTVNGNGTSLAFPTMRGTSGQFLKTDGAGGTSWSGVTKSDVALGNVENTALSTWAGSANITTLGTITTGTWHGTAITESYIGSLSASKITSGTFDNARINWAAPGTIGSATPSSGTFTSVSANNGLSVSNGTVNIKPAGSGGTSGQVLTTDGAGNATWQAAATPVTTLNIRFLICVNGLWPGSGSDSHFIGEVVMFAGTESMIPEEFMECKGQSLSAAAYSALFTVIQYTYGGSGTTFKLPDFTSKVPKGL